MRTGDKKSDEVKKHLGNATDTPEWNEYKCLYNMIAIHIHTETQRHKT